MQGELVVKIESDVDSHTFEILEEELGIEKDSGSDK